MPNYGRHDQRWCTILLTAAQQPRNSRALYLKRWKTNSNDQSIMTAAHVSTNLTAPIPMWQCLMAVTYIQNQNKKLQKITARKSITSYCAILLPAQRPSCARYQLGMVIACLLEIPLLSTKPKENTQKGIAGNYSTVREVVARFFFNQAARHPPQYLF